MRVCRLSQIEEAIHKAVEDRKLKPADLAKMAKISRPLAYKIGRDKNLSINWRTMKKLCKALGILWE